MRLGTPWRASSSLLHVACAVAIAAAVSISAFGPRQALAQERIGDKSSRSLALSEPAGPYNSALTSDQSAQTVQATATGAAMTLSDLERLALQNNPTLAQAEAALRAAQGRRRQAGLWPNPTIGYRGEELSFRAFSEKSEHFGFIEQEILLGGKLKKSQRIVDQEIVQAESEAAAQKQRVINTIRMLYFEVLGSQQRIELRNELSRIAREAVRITSELQNVGQADRPDYLEAEVEANQVELDLISAQNEHEELWRVLTNTLGQPELKPTRLEGNLEPPASTLDREALMMTLLNESPEIKQAQAELERSRAVLARAKAERVPDLVLRGALGYSTEALETRNGPQGKTGPEASIEVGLRVPLFNRNQGGIAAAEAELALAERNLDRTRLALRVRLAQVFRDYTSAATSVRVYRESILPRTERAYNMYLTSFRQMAASYPQVLISQRTMFQVREDYLNALVQLRQRTVQLEGYLLTGALDAPRSRGADASAERMETTIERFGSRRDSE